MCAGICICKHVCVSVYVHMFGRTNIISAYFPALLIPEKDASLRRPLVIIILASFSCIYILLRILKVEFEVVIKRKKRRLPIQRISHYSTAELLANNFKIVVYVF